MLLNFIIIDVIIVIIITITISIKIVDKIIFITLLLLSFVTTDSLKYLS